MQPIRLRFGYFGGGQLDIIKGQIQKKGFPKLYEMGTMSRPQASVMKTSIGASNFNCL